MSIPISHQQALSSSPEFNAQVNACVVEQSLIRYGDGTDVDDATRNLIRGVSVSPQNYNFPQVIVADGGWGLTFDAWAADPKGAGEGPILSAVQKYLPLLAGI